MSSDAIAELRFQLGEVLPVAVNVPSDVSALVAMMAITTLEQAFYGLGDKDQTQALRRPSVAESEVEAIDGTVDMVLAEEDETE